MRSASHRLREHEEIFADGLRFQRGLENPRHAPLGVEHGQRCGMIDVVAIGVGGTGGGAACSGVWRSAGAPGAGGTFMKTSERLRAKASREGTSAVAARVSG